MDSSSQFEAKPQENQVKPYLFDRSLVLSKGFLQRIKKIHDFFSISLTASLQDFLKTDIHVELLNIDKLAWKKYFLSVTNPSFIVSLDVSSINSFSVLEVNPVLVHSVVNRLLGGEGEAPVFALNLQKVEMAFTRKFFNLIVKDLGLAWRDLQAITFSINEIHQKMSTIEVGKQDEMALVATFKLMIGKVSGLMTIAFPFSPFWSLISQAEGLESKAEQSNSNPQYVNLDDVEVELKAILGRFQLSLGDLKNLQIGDVLEVGQDTSVPIEVSIAGENKFKAIPGLIQNYKGIVLQKPFSRQENNRWMT